MDFLAVSTPAKVAILVGGFFTLAFLGYIGEKLGGKESKKGSGMHPDMMRNMGVGPRGPPQSDHSNMAPPSVQEIMQMLAKAEQAKTKGKYDEADSLYRQAIEVIEEDPEMGVKHHYYALVSYALALNLKQKGDYDGAEQWLTKSIDIFTEQGIPESQDELADALATLADLYLLLKRPDDAEASLQKSLNLVFSKMKMINDYNPKNASDQNEKDEALKKVNQELGILHDTFARIKFDQKKFADAEDLGKKSLLYLLTGFGEDKSAEPFITRSLLKLAECFLAQGKTKEAGDLYDKLLAEQRNNGSQITVATFSRLFGTAASQYKCWDLAEFYLEQAADIFEEYDENPKAIQDYVDILAVLIPLKIEAKREEDAIKNVIHRMVTFAEQNEVDVPLMKSVYFTTEKAEVKVLPGPDATPFYSVTIKLNPDVELPSEGCLVVEYPRLKDEEDENDDEDEDVVYSKVEIALNSSTLLQSGVYEFESPKLKALKEEHYLITFYVFSDLIMSSAPVTRHPVIVKCPVDTVLESETQEN